ncbi:hypothetical protein ANN_13421 [Periplaneta americana]|uniref:Uncharacterized protein n=1 Tax=Periplaneta americana TaxID=6978 RepID=A0ABQ8TJD1_PERAM|nr:hypothetical protein ANN_13421 [Periplaneta americana]
MAGLCEGGNEPPGSLKSSKALLKIVFLQKPRNIDDQRVKITQAFQQITPLVLQRTWAVLDHRFEFCRVRNGGHVEDLFIEPDLRKDDSSCDPDDNADNSKSDHQSEAPEVSNHHLEPPYDPETHHDEDLSINEKSSYHQCDPQEKNIGSTPVSRIKGSTSEKEGHVFSMNKLAEKHKEFNKSSFIVFKDDVKAFERVVRCKLWEIMENKGFPRHLIKAARSLHTDTKIQMECSETRNTCPITITQVVTGMRTLSNIFYPLY